MDRSQMNDISVLLAAAGFLPVTSVFQGEIFGSWHLVVERGRRRFRIAWDGKDRWLTIERGRRPLLGLRPTLWTDARIGKLPAEQTPATVLTQLQSLSN
jgi:hypothetical protein